MSETKSPTIFISHISEEAPIAIALQSQLESMFGASVRIFVSSDKKSIQGGMEWFNVINATLKTCDVLIALLSDISATRVWIPYEVGVAYGAQRRVILLTVRDSIASKLPYPFAGFQIWSIGDMPSVVREIATSIKVTPTVPELGTYRGAISKAEASVTYKRVVFEPVIVNPSHPSVDTLMMCHMHNIGNTDIDLLHIEIYFPEAILKTGATRYQFPNQVVWDHYVIEETPYKRVRYWTFPGAGNEPLIPTITPSMGEIRPAYPRMILNPKLIAELETMPVFYQLHARNYSTTRQSIALGHLRRVEEFEWDATFSSSTSPQP